MKIGKILGFVGTAVSVIVSVVIIAVMMGDAFKDDLAANPTAGIEKTALALKIICVVMLVFATFSFLILIFWKEDRLKPLGEFLSFFAFMHVILLNVIALGFLLSAGIILIRIKPAPGGES
jgi:hypothetical protein